MPLLSSKGEPLRNPYELLKLELGATDDEISKSFKKLMLHLHPDKRPPGLSIEEAENVERAMHDVMEARSFLLDTEYMAARRQYDGKLLLAEQRRQQFQHLPPRNKKDLNIGTSKQSPSLPAHHQQETKINPVPAAAPPVTSTKVGGGGKTTTRAKSTSKSRLESPADDNNNNSYDNNKTATARGTKSVLYGLGSKNETTAVSTTPATELSVEKLEKLLAAKKAERSSSTLLNKNLNKKHWGKVKTRCRAANVKKKKVDDGNEKKDNSRRMGKASFSSSCSDCSTTEDNTTSDDDLKQSYHTYLNGINSDTAISSSKKSAADVDATTTNNNKPSSSTTAKSSVPQPSNNNSCSNNSSNKGKKKSFLRDSLPQPPVRQKSFHDPRPQLLQPQTHIEKCERSKSFSSTILHPLHPTVKGKCYLQIFECVTPQQELVKPPPTTYKPRPTSLNDAIPVPQQRPFPSTIGYTSTSSRPTTTTNTTTTTLLLEKQYYCPLTKNIMKEPMSDNEGNTYERQAILTYLEIHNNKSPITGNALFPMQLIPNTSLAEQIRLALITCLDTLRE